MGEAGISYMHPLSKIHFLHVGREIILFATNNIKRIFMAVINFFCEGWREDRGF